jgi:UDPglucose 6-dehydrogenase
VNVVIVGIGRVGLVAACCLANSGHHVTGIESNGTKLELLSTGVSPICEKGVDDLLKDTIDSGRLTFSRSFPVPLKAEVLMITVNTPPLDNGGADLSQVYNVIAQVKKVVRNPLVLVMKSTVPPGTGVNLVKDYLEGTPITYVANPEFLRAGQAIDDWYHPSRTVIGTASTQAADKVRQLYVDIEAPLLVTDVTSAEMVKYAANAFLSTKVSFINEVANLCEAVGANIEDVVRGLGLDPRIGTAHLQPGVGYGGPCLPKDATALEFLATSKGYDFKLLKAAIEVNARQRALVIEKLKRPLGPLRGKEIALLGLAFKPGVDDITEAPAVDIARLLVAEGANLRVYDPMAMDSARPLLPDSVGFYKDIYSATAGACAIILATEWPEFIQVDWNRIKKAMVEPCAVVDGRNALPQESLLAIGFKYIGVGRGL